MTLRPFLTLLVVVIAAAGVTVLAARAISGAVGPGGLSIALAVTVSLVLWLRLWGPRP